MKRDDILVKSSEFRPGPLSVKKILLSFFVLSFACVQAATLVVDANPESSIFGSRSCEAGLFSDNPYELIQDAIDDANNGDTISICDGLYNENLEIDDWKNNLTIRKSLSASGDVIVQNSDNVLKIEEVNNITINGLTFESLDEEGINIEGWATGIVLQNLKISAKKEGILIDKNIGTLEIKNSSITAEQGLQVDNEINGIELSNLVIEATDTGIEFKKDLNTDVEFTDVEITAYNGDGITFDAVINNGIIIDSLKIIAAKKGLNFKKDVYSSFSIANTTIDSAEEGINIEGKETNPVITNSSISSSEKDAVFTEAKNWTNFTLKNSCLTASKSGSYALQIDINKLNSDSEILDNCFYAQSLQYLAKAKGDTTGEKFDGNYWDGHSGSYTQNNISDTSPRATCPNSCGVVSTPVPIVEYRFDECKWDGTLGEVKDNSGNGNDGTSEGAVLFEDGVLNSAADFDGSGTIETGDILALRNTATLSFWIKTTQSGDNTTWNAPGVVGVEQSGGGDDIIWGFIDANGKIGIDVGTTGSSYAKSSTSINNNIFHHIVLSRDGASGEVKVYVNGVLEDTESLKTGEIGNSFTKLGIIRDTGGSHEYLNAIIDEFKVFDTVLSDAQVRDIYNYEKEGENYDGSGERASVDCSVVSLCYEDNFNRADLGSKWSIIKAYNFTPSVISNKLVLTEDSNNIAAGVSLSGTFPSNDNLVEIEFEHNAYARNNGADGVTVVLSDGNTTPVAGAYGGSLGYAQRSDNGGHDGFQGGWLGFGIDEYGNFANDSEGRGSGCSSHPPSGRILDSITIRGRQGSSLRNGFCFIANSGVLDPQIDDKDPRNHKYKFIIDTRGGTKITVQRDTNDGNGYVTLPNMDEADATQAAAAPPTFRLSFTGSTGGSKNWHTLDNLKVSAIGCGTLGKEQEKVGNFFDAWDTSGDIASREIKTKIVREDFELNVVALNDTNTTYQDFNGTVCTRLIDVISDSNITNWQKVLFTGANLQKQTYNSTYASKEAKVEIAWKDGVDEACPLGSDFNTTRSTDNFAIRPDRFDFTSAGDRFAGENFILDISALGASGNDALAYNETKDSSFEILSTIAKAGCANGVLSIANFTFADGAQSIDANYSENGDVNVTIQEISGSEFANIDSGDTPLADRLIAPVAKTISIKPYELNITRADYIASTGSDWLYMADVSDMNVTASAIVQANNKQHQALQNFDALCYASDVDLDFKYSVVNPNSDINISYIPNSLGLEQDIVNIDKTITIADSNFTSGVANVQYSFNINRSQDTPLSPVNISLEDAEVASTDVAKDENNATVGINKTFLYGRLRAYDVETSMKPEVEVPLFIEVYDPSGSFDDVWQENSLNWYTNKWHDNNSSFGGIVDLNSTSLEGGLSDTDSDITQVSSNTADGIVNLKLNHVFEDEAQKRTIHLDISPWLWHLPGNNANTYDYSPSSTCKEHPCFEFYYYPYSTSEVGNAVHSGSADGFGGSDFNLTDTKRTQQGVKVFR